MSARTKREIQEIVRKVQDRLDAGRQARGIALRVPEDGYTQDDEWLHVIVTPVEDGVRAYDYVQALEDVEKELRQSGVKNVLLVPALGD